MSSHVLIVWGVIAAALALAAVAHRRRGDEDDPPEEDPPDDNEHSRSYHVFFVSPEGKAFTFETETEGIAETELITEEFEEAGWGEGPPVSRISGVGRTGWVVAVSLLARSIPSSKPCLPTKAWACDSVVPADNVT